jgi:hypothetical protein
VTGRGTSVHRRRQGNPKARRVRWATVPPALRPVLVAVPLILALAGCAAGGGSGSAAAGTAQSADAAVTISAVTPLTGSVSGGTTVSITGSELGAVASAKVGGVEVPVEPSADGSQATFTAPAAAGFASGAQDLVLLDAAGKVLHQGQYDYEVTTPVDRQLSYALAHWQDYNTAEYETLGTTDCVNFTSQTLLQRGWKQDDEWYYGDGSVLDASASWRSSTAFRDWLESRPDLATALDDTQRDQIVPGDVVQFDWDQSGDRDHTGVVTRVEHTDAGTKIYFAGHTLDSDFRDVDTAITVDHPGGLVYYWHLTA